MGFGIGWLFGGEEVLGAEGSSPWQFIKTAVKFLEEAAVDQVGLTAKIMAHSVTA